MGDILIGAIFAAAGGVAGYFLRRAGIKLPALPVTPVPPAPQPTPIDPTPADPLSPSPVLPGVPADLVPQVLALLPALVQLLRQRRDVQAQQQLATLLAPGEDLATK